LHFKPQFISLASLSILYGAKREKDLGNHRLLGLKVLLCQLLHFPQISAPAYYFYVNTIKKSKKMDFLD
jgi:hypothetical protein